MLTGTSLIYNDLRLCACVCGKIISKTSYGLQLPSLMDFFGMTLFQIKSPRVNNASRKFWFNDKELGTTFK